MVYFGSPKYSDGSYVEITGSQSHQILIDTTLVKSPTKQLSTTTKVKSGLPLRLEIPKININTIIKHMGITSQGAMDMSKGATDVVRFNLGPRPGNTGSAVIAGHY